MTHQDDEFEWIHVAYITTRTGQRIYAWQKGKKSFYIRVRRRDV